MIEENLKVLKKESKIKRSNFYKMLMLLLLGIVLVGCKNVNFSFNATLKVNDKDIQVVEGETVTVTPTVSGSENALVYTSSNPNVFTVDQTGKVTGVSAGTGVLTIKISGTEISAIVNVTVTEA